MRTATLSILLLSAALAGCQDPDVGQSCSLRIGAGNTGVTADYFESNPANGCDNLVCIKSPDRPQGNTCSQADQAAGIACGYCSKACVSNADCFQSDTGLVCRAVTVDFNYINSLKQPQRDAYYTILGCSVPVGGTQEVCDANGQNCHGVTPPCPYQFQSYCAAPLQ
jgi:hypothetical protein